MLLLETRVSLALIHVRLLSRKEMRITTSMAVSLVAARDRVTRYTSAFFSLQGMHIPCCICLQGNKAGRSY